MIAGILFTIVLGINNPQKYDVIDSCKTFGSINFPADDTKQHRVISLCLEQIVAEDKSNNLLMVKNVIDHEVFHACFHDHVHSYKDKKELQKHIDTNYSEEYVASKITLECLTEGQHSFAQGLTKFADLLLIKIDDAKKSHI